MISHITNLDHPTVEQMYHLFKTKYPTIDTAPDEPMTEWQKIVDSATNLQDLRNKAQEYTYLPLVGEAIYALSQLTDNDWESWQSYVAKNRAAAKDAQVQFDDAEMQKFACIIVPPTLLNITMVSNHYIAPFVVAMEQMARADILQVKGQWLTMTPS